MKKVFLTREGLEKLKAELLTIQNETLPALEADLISLEVLGKMSSKLYEIAKWWHGFYTKRVANLNEMIDNHQIIGATACELSEVEKGWEEFWAEIVLNEDGTVNMDQVKAELSDFRALIGNVRKVYDHVTGGNVTNVLTIPEVVCREADENYRLCYEGDEDINDEG